jgi:hypothetical protein
MWAELCYVAAKLQTFILEDQILTSAGFSPTFTQISRDFPQFLQGNNSVFRHCIYQNSFVFTTEIHLSISKITVFRDVTRVVR